MDKKKKVRLVKAPAKSSPTSTLYPVKEKLYCIHSAPKDLIVRWLVDKQWVVQPKNIVNKVKLDELRRVLYEAMLLNGTVNDIKEFERQTVQYLMERQSHLDKRTQESNERRQRLLEWAQSNFKVGGTVHVFDEVQVGSISGSAYAQKPIYRQVPIDVTVVSLSDDCRNVTVQFKETRKWHEAGGWPVHKGQIMKFKFDNTTCKWLREGLTAEVCRSYDTNGDVRYFDLSYTRQYLVSP